MRRRVAGAACGAALAVLLMGACTDTDSGDGAAPTPPNSPSIAVTLPVPPTSAPSALPSSATAAPTPTGTAPQDAALDAYKQMMAAMVQASLTSDPNFPLLAKYATGEALVTLRYSLQANQRKGFVGKGPMRMAPRVESVSPDGLLVRMSDCVDDSEWLTYRLDGSLAGGPPGGRRSTTAEVIPVDGAWKVSVLRVSATGTC